MSAEASQRSIEQATEIVRKLCFDRYTENAVISFLALALDAARAEEREVCAKFIHDQLFDAQKPERYLLAGRLTAAIRNRQG